MRIGIDASSILPARTGVGNYTFYLIKTLLRVDSHNQYVIYLNSYSQPMPDITFLKRDNVTIKRYHIVGPLLLQAWRFINFPPIDVFTGGIDVFHSPAGLMIPQLKGKRILTLHDLYFMEHPEDTDIMGGKYLRQTLPAKIHKADHIIAVSHATKADIVKHLNVPSGKITVIYEGVDFLRFRIIVDTSPLNFIRQEYCLPQQFILTVATLEPRKNIEGLLFAYRRLKQIIHNPPKLVIVGRQGWKSDTIPGTLQELGLQRDVIFTGYVSDEHLPLIYSNALMFVYPSFHEGFGLPVLEAMACGVPVLTSDTSALREIVGDAAITVDPTNYYALAERMKEIITSHKIRSQLKERALNHVRNFSWESCARKTLNVYENLLP